MFFGDRHLFHHHHRRGGALSGGLFLIAFIGVGGWNQIQGHRFSSACSAITTGELQGTAEQRLEKRGGRRVRLADPRPNASEYRFKSVWGTDRNCTIEVADGMVVKTSGSRSVTF